MVAHVDRDLPSDLYFANIAGLVGEGAAAEYTGFKRIFENLPDIDSIIMNPAKSEVPTDPAVMYALCGALAHRVSKDNFDRVTEYIDRLPADFQVMTIIDAQKLQPAIKQTRAYTKWAVANANVFM